MKVTVERPSDAEAVLNVEFDWAELEKASDTAYKKLAQRYAVPGFRKGHAPRSMLERMLGKEAIYQEGLESLIDSSYRDAIRQHDLTPIAQPEVEAPALEIGQPYSFTAKVAILPPVKLGDYKAVQVERPDATVTDQDVEDTLERIRQDQAAWVPVERPAEIGNKVTVDLKLTAGDRTVSDLHDNEFELTDERAGIFSGMDPQIVGMSEGETKEFDTTIPEDYANTELAGKQAHYAVTVKGVKQRELPEIDDDLAKASGDYENVQALRDAVRTQLTNQKESDARRNFREAVLKAVTDASEVEVPEPLAHDEIHTMMNEQERMLEQSRLSLKQYLEMLGKTEEEYHDELKPEAAARVKRELVLDAVADAEGIGVTEREMESWLELLAMVGGQRRRLRDLSASQRAAVIGRLRRDKASTRLVDIATANAGGDEAQSEAGAQAAAASASGIDDAMRESASQVADQMAQIESSAQTEPAPKDAKAKAKGANGGASATSTRPAAASADAAEGATSATGETTTPTASEV